MFIEAIIIGIIVGIVRNGRLSNLSELNFRGWYLILFGFIIQYLPLFFSLFNFELFNDKWQIVGNIIILITLILNINFSGVWIIILGGIINSIGYIINDYNVMIVKTSISEKMINYIDTGALVNYKYFSQVSHWKHYFGKFIALPEIYPLVKAISIGDIIISIGIIFFISMEMKKIYYKNRGSMLRFSYNKNI